MWIILRSMKFCWSFGMQFAGNVLANWEREVLLHHDNARPHTARATQGRIQELHSKLLEHPTYSPDLVPNQFHMFRPLKNYLGVKRFADGEVETEVQKWLRQQSKSIYPAGFDALVKRWVKCSNVSGGYVEKYIIFFQVRISYILRFISVTYLLTLPRMYTNYAIYITERSIAIEQYFKRATRIWFQRNLNSIKKIFYLFLVYNPLDCFPVDWPTMTDNRTLWQDDKSYLIIHGGL
jgi:hypothetical protein